jgi:arginyl-tRNA synthetase
MEQALTQFVRQSLKDLFQIEAEEEFQLQKTRKEFKGDYTVNVFPWVKQIRKAPDDIARQIGDYLHKNADIVAEYEVVKGFLNISLTDKAFLDKLVFYQNTQVNKSTSSKIVIEFSSPNTNKPLHLGHIRNNLIGESVSRILKAAGYEVIKVNLVNDRGIHICKSMLAWQKWGNGITPETAGKKGDKLVGDFYVLFDKEYKKQIKEWMDGGLSKEEAEKKAPLMLEAQEMLLKWEHGDDEIMSLWKTMNQWVYKGFDNTYKKLGIEFDKIYYESETFKLGKKYVMEGLQKGVFYKKEDGSIWVDLTPDGLDEKLLLRADGTSVYITQDIGTAVMRYESYKPDKMLYVVGNEQNYHFQVLKLVLKKLGFAWAENIKHLSYGMVELPEGKMKSREGTVVDADDLIDELVHEAYMLSMELGKLKDEAPEKINEATHTIAMAALKYFILKVDPEKNMLFNPKESVDFDGNTGPFILYTYSRIKSLIRKAEETGIVFKTFNVSRCSEKEKELIKLYIEFSQTLTESAGIYSPAKLANYIYAMAKEFNQYYQQVPILKEEDKNIREYRLYLSNCLAELIKSALTLLGIGTLEKM